MKLSFTSVLAILGVALPLTATVLTAGPNTVILDTAPYYPGLGGGEFTATTTQNFIANYDSRATANNGFETFCLETGVEFSPGKSYYYTLGTVTQPESGGGAGSGLALSQGAAYLYYQFGKGLLGDYAYTELTVRKTDDNLLQAAIWALQGGQSYGGYPSGGTGNKFYDDAIAALGADAGNAYTGSSVKVLQVWTSYVANPDGSYRYSGAAQNQLVLVPDGGITVALLGGALIGLQVVRRKFFR